MQHFHQAETATAGRQFLRGGLGALALLLCTGLGGSTSGCSSDAAGDGCSSDDQCPVGARCDLTRERCVCTSDEACGEGSFCNNAGVCQLRSGCASNADCGQTTFCDLESGTCLARPAEPALGTPCGLASHCPFGAVCRDGACVEGCFENGDCPLGQICLEGACFTGGPGERVCTESSFCEYGDVCGNDNLCRDDRRGPYCRGCSPRTTMNPNPCDDPRNFCLINSQELGGFTNFCGVDCSLGQACPSGYSCNNIIVLTRATCGSTAECRCDPDRVSFATATCGISQPCQPRLPSGEIDPDAQSCVIEGAAACNGGSQGGEANCVVPRGQVDGNCTCATDDDCPNAGACVAGLCCGGEVRPEEDLRCVGGEGRVTGFCTCATDDDCGRDSCDPSSGSCRITGVPCDPGQSDCPPIACVNGGCLIGRNCAPEQGLACSEVSGR